MAFKERLSVIILFIFILLPNLILADSINTVSITKDTLSGLASCVHYRIVGVCEWLSFPDGINTTPKVKHYLPDLVVTVYPKYRKDPWFEANNTIDIADHIAGNATYRALNNGMSIQPGGMDSEGNSDNDIKLKEVDVIGNPALFTLHTFPFLLHGQAFSMMPYYQSQLDSNQWRSGLLERAYIQFMIPGKDIVGTFILNDWGSVYPREGFIIQPNVGKASAVIAVRGANIATTHSYNHLSVDLASQTCRDHACTKPGKVDASSSKTEWQMIMPNDESSCHKKINTSMNPSWTKGQPDKQPYAWIVWREYEGCVQGRGIFLTSIGG